MAADDRAVALLKRLDKLKSVRGTWEEHWQQIADYIVPRKGNVTRKRTPGAKRMELVYDGTAIHAAEMLSASLHGMLTNPNLAWFELAYMDREYNEDDEALEYLEKVSEIMNREFQRSNFSEQVHELYHDLVTFGTGVMFITNAPENNGVRFATRHISECYVAEDELGRIDTVYREFKMNLRSLVRQFGEDAIGDEMRKKLAKDPYDEITVVHIVMPRDDRDAQRIDAANKPFASIYIEPKQKIVLREGGFDEFAYVCPRFLKSSSDEGGYGRSPAMTALPDTAMINAMSKTTIAAAQKQVDPPLMVPDYGFVLPVRTRPGGLNYYRSGSRDRIEPLNIGANNPLGLNVEQQRREAIRQAFYVDQLLMGNGPQMTATEAILKNEEKMRLMGPLMGRLQAELLQPMIERVYALLQRQRQFPDPPDIIQGRSFDIEYVSPMAKAQRQTDVQSIMRLFELLAPIASVDAGVFDHLDVDGLVRHMLKTLSIPASVTKGEGEVSLARDERAAQEEMMMQMQQAQQTAQSLGAVAPAIKAIGGVEPV
ncbi:MAG: hypothetical protein CMG46_13945 [Candidatus Marinimicrobia bacterium]|nr:hypothetical protein [Candidatus Neomarinimicrobiota bacterium]